MPEDRATGRVPTLVWLNLTLAVVLLILSALAGIAFVGGPRTVFPGRVELLTVTVLALAAIATGSTGVALRSGFGWWRVGQLVSLVAWGWLIWAALPTLRALIE